MATPLLLQISANNSNSLKAWHSFYYPDSITQSGTVTNMLDLSGNGNDLDAGNAPSYVSESGNFKSGAYFDGVQNYLETTGTIDFSANNAATIFYVFRYTGNPKSVSTKKIIGSQNDADSNNILSINTTERYGSEAFGLASESYQNIDNKTHVMAIKASSSSGEREMWIDGTMDHSTSITWANGNGEIGIGRDINALSNYFDGFVFEFAVFNVALTDDEIISISRDMGTRYNVSVNNVPSDAFYWFDTDSTKTETLNGSDFSAIASRVGSLSVSQATAAQQPTKSEGLLNGYTGATFIDADNTVLDNVGSGSTSNSFTGFVVGAVDNQGVYTTYTANSNGNYGWTLVKTEDEELSLRIGNGSSLSDIKTTTELSADDFKVPHVISFTFDGSSGKLYFNGTQVASGTKTIAFSTQDILYGSYDMNGKLGDSLYYERVLSDTERKNVENYLINKYVNPLVTVDLDYFYDISKPKTLTFNGTGVSGVVNIEGTSAYDCSQSTASEQPTFDGYGLKSHSALITTNANDQAFTFANGTLPQPTNVTIYVVSKATLDASITRMIIRNFLDSKGYRVGILSTGRLMMRIGTDSGAINFSSAILSYSELAKSFVACFRYDGSNMKIDFNNGGLSFSGTNAHTGDIIYDSPACSMFSSGDVDANTSLIASHGVSHDDDTVKTNINYLLRQFNIG